MQRRFADSAKQIVLYRACGDPEFAERLRESAIPIGKFMQLLSACSSERIDSALILDEALNAVSRKAAGSKCDSQLQALAKDRRSNFETMMNQANDPAVANAILDNFAIRIDAGGNIVETTSAPNVAASADEAAGRRAAESLVKAFISFCVQSLPRLDLVEGTTKLLNWKQINGLEGTLAAPANPNAKGKTWLVQGVADVPFKLATSRAVEEGETFSTCTVENPYAPEAPIHAAFVDILRLDQPINVETEGGQRYTYWQTPFAGRDILGTLIDASPSKDPGVNLTAAVKEKAN